MAPDKSSIKSVLVSALYMIAVTISVLIELLNSISSDQHKLACLLSPNHQGYYNTRHERSSLRLVPAFAKTASKSRSHQPCAVVQTCYYNVSLCLITFFFFFFFLINKMVISLSPLFCTFYSVVNNQAIQPAGCNLIILLNPSIYLPLLEEVTSSVD